MGGDFARSRGLLFGGGRNLGDLGVDIADMSRDVVEDIHNVAGVFGHRIHIGDRGIDGFGRHLSLRLDIFDHLRDFLGRGGSA